MTTKSKKTTAVKKSFDYTTIKTFEDACKSLKIVPEKLPDLTAIPEEFHKTIIAGYKLMIVYKAINNGWRLDWSNHNQYKYYPWFRVLSSGFGFSTALYYCAGPFTRVGSRLYTDTADKAIYIGTQFEKLYRDYFLYSE